MKAGKWLSLILIGLCLGAMWWAGCSSDGDGTTGPVLNADSLADLGNQAFGEIMYDLVNNSEPESPEDIDFSRAYNYFTQALQNDAQNPDANFGAGVLEVVMLTRNAQVQDFFDRLQSFVDADSYFEVPGSALAGDIGAPKAFPAFRELPLPVTMPMKIARRMCRVTDDNEPTVAELQGLCTSLVLPRIQTAIQRLTVVSNHADFTFTVTPQMQGDPNEDAVILDQTEVRTTLAGLYAVEAILLHFCAYDLNFPAYDGPAMLQAFGRSSSFATLQSGGEEKMQQAHDAWLGAVNSIEQAVAFLEHENPANQTNHLIRLDPHDGITQEDLDSLQAYLPKIRNALNNSETFSFQTSDNPAELITISLNAMFNNPIQNWKMLYPEYTVSLDTQTVDYYWNLEGDTVTAHVQIPSAGYYDWYHYGRFEFGTQVWNTYSAPFAAPEWDQAFAAKALQHANLPSVSIHIYYYGYLSAGSQTLTGHIGSSWNVPTHERFVPIITWEATSFEEWILPDPTMGGLLPGMTDQRFKQLFNMTASDWTRSGTWYLW